jgi:acetylornithine deacetylase/succinyl-diaminopimelate desuccinylase-like protein
MSTLPSSAARSACLDRASAVFDDGRYLDVLTRRVAMRTDSDGGNPDVTPLAAYLAQEILPGLQALGFEGRLIANPAGRGGPMLIARRVEDPDLPTLLSYGHGDVVSGQDASWRNGRSPWCLSVEGERWYGRGTADNKGQHTICLLALEQVLAARDGRLGYNMTLLLETGEELGSPGLREVCKQEREALQADLFIASDGPRVNASRPTLFMGSRGSVNFKLRLKARDLAYHSGNWGGVLANPGIRLSHAIASLVDERGQLQVAGLRPPPLSPALRRVLAEIEVGGGPDDPALSEGWGEAGLSAAERLFGWNTLEVLALHAGRPERPVNAIPPEATAHLQLRFVVGTDWPRTEAILRQHLDAAGFADVQIEIGMVGPATRLDVEHPWVNWAADSITRSSDGGQRPTLLPNLAGSLPNDLFADLLGLPTLWVPHSYPACAQHAPDEHLLAPIAREGLRLMAGLYWDLGEPGAPWGSATRPHA